MTTTGDPRRSLPRDRGLPSGVTFVDNGNGTATLSGTPAVGTAAPTRSPSRRPTASGRHATQTFTLTVDVALPSPDHHLDRQHHLHRGHGRHVHGHRDRQHRRRLSPRRVPALRGDLHRQRQRHRHPVRHAGGRDRRQLPDHHHGRQRRQPQRHPDLHPDRGRRPAITSANTTTFAEGSSGTFTVTSTGTPTATLTETGSLPTGVTFVDNGNGTATLAGTPAAGTRGTYPITITATDGVSPNATQSFTLTVDGSAGHHLGQHHHLRRGNAGTFTVTATGDPTAALSRPGSLPTGVTFTANGNGTATLAGTPAPGRAAATRSPSRPPTASAPTPPSPSP